MADSHSNRYGLFFSVIYITPLVLRATNQNRPFSKAVS